MNQWRQYFFLDDDDEAAFGGLLKSHSVTNEAGSPFGLFSNNFLEIKWFDHFALFLAFFRSWRKWYLFRPITAKFQLNIYHRLTFQNFCNIFWHNFFENLAFIRLFSPFQNLAFFKTSYGQIWPFYFLGAGKPDMKKNVAWRVLPSSSSSFTLNQERLIFFWKQLRMEVMPTSISIYSEILWY